MRRVAFRLVLPLAVGGALLAGCGSAPVADAPGCPSAEDVAAQLQRYTAVQPLPNPPATLTMEAAQCGARKFTAALVASQGRVIGYKAGLTNPMVQQRFGVSQPIFGVLFEKMMLKDGAEVPASYASRPVLESDLVVEVASSAINEAKTPQEVLASLKAIYPFIELPDLVVQDPTKITGPTIALINVGARLGVLGAPIPARTDAAFADALRDMTVRMTDLTGREINAPKGSAILGHPLNAVVWLAAELKRQGRALKPGDMLSLGAFASAPVVAGNGVRVSYEGLASNATVSVRFR